MGPIYVNSVSGPKMYEFMEGGWDVYRPEGVVLDRKAENTQFFQVIRIEGMSLVYKAYMANGELYDAFELRKNGMGRDQCRIGLGFREGTTLRQYATVQSGRHLEVPL